MRTNEENYSVCVAERFQHSFLLPMTTWSIYDLVYALAIIDALVDLLEPQN